MKYLDLIDKNHDIIITSSQVEMEYKKHRAEEIRKTYDSLNLPNWGSLTPPPILFDSEPAQIITKLKKQIEKQQKILKERILKVFNDPVRNDKVFQTVQRLFKNGSDLNLNRENKERFRIRKLALKRFMLGYPPKKIDDNSIGDAINWEWIVDCGYRKNLDIIIVSRDTDYGQHISADQSSVINEWLGVEFKERTNKRRKVILTNKLSFAFKEAVSKKSVTKKMESAETEVLLENEVRHEEGTKLTTQDRLKALQLVIDRLEKTYGKKE